MLIGQWVTSSNISVFTSTLLVNDAVNDDVLAASDCGAVFLAAASQATNYKLVISYGASYFLILVSSILACPSVWARFNGFPSDPINLPNSASTYYDY